MISIIALGLVCWFATYLIVESEFFRPLRDTVTGLRSWTVVKLNRSTRRLPARFWNTAALFWAKVDYLFGCHTCTGTWVGLVLAFYAPAVFGLGLAQFVLVGLLIKAIGHIVLILHKYGESVTDQTKRPRRG